VHRMRSATLGVLLDVAFMVAGVAVGWFTAAELMLAVWMQTAVPILVVPLILVWASVRAPDDPAVDAGEPLRSNGKEIVGRAAARDLAWFFPLHFGLFIAALGMFLTPLLGWSGLFGAGVLTMTVLAVRSVIASLPVAIADVRFVRADGFAHLADKAKALLWRPYARLFPLHLGTLVLLLRGGDAGGASAAAIIGIVAVVTFAGSTIRYPELPPSVPIHDDGQGSAFAAHRPPG
jgi:hypothetical protein